MKNKKYAWALITLSCLAPALHAQTLTYQWDTELCSYRAQYNAAQVSKAQLDGSLVFTRLAGSVLLSATSLVFEPAQLSSISLQAIDHEYRTTKTKLKATPVLAPFAALKQRTLSRLEFEYTTNRLEAQALLGQPQRLLTTAYGQASLRYAKMLNHPDAAQQIKLWNQLIEAQIREQEKLGNSGYRIIAQQRQARQSASNAQAYAKIDFIQAWHNHLQWPNTAIHQQDTRTDWNLAFIKAARLTHLKEECDEP